MTDPVCPCGQRTALECLGDDCTQERPMNERCPDCQTPSSDGRCHNVTCLRGEICSPPAPPVGPFHNCNDDPTRSAFCPGCNQLVGLDEDVAIQMLYGCGPAAWSQLSVPDKEAFRSVFRVAIAPLLAHARAEAKRETVDQIVEMLREENALRYARGVPTEFAGGKMTGWDESADFIAAHFGRTDR